MSVSVAGFRTRFPEFSDITEYPEARVQIFLDDASLCVDPERFLTMTDIAIYYLAAHDLSIGERTAAGSGSASEIGPVTSKSAGQVSKSHAVNSLDLNQSDSYYQQTLYGLKYLNIRDKIKVPAFFTVCKVRFV
jgi:hypothetical protein